MITEKQSIIDEILYGDTFKNIDPPKNGTNRTGSDNGKNNNCNFFNELCQKKLQNDYSGEHIVDIFSFVQKIDQSFCLNKLVNIKDFVSDFFSGYGRDKLIKNHHLVNIYNIRKLQKILGIKTKREHKSNDGSVLEQNLQNQESSEIFNFINKYADEFRDELNLFYTISWARVHIITHLLFQKIKKTELKLNENGIIEEAIHACKGETWKTDDECERILHSLNELGIKPLDELVEQGIIHRHEGENNHVTLSINEDLLRFEDYILKQLEEADGTMRYGAIVDKLIENNLLCQYAPLPAIWDFTFDKLEKEKKIRRTSTYALYGKFQDQIELVKFQQEKEKRTEEARNKATPTGSKQKKFFGRKIDPVTFLKELELLEKGDIEDDDDQVTRIAGMVLSNSNMLKAPTEFLEVFDFAMDMSDYEFTPEQREILKETKIELTSKTIHAKIMINESVSDINNLIYEIKNVLPSNEQAFIITNLPPGFPDLIELREKLPNDKSIQIIDRDQFSLWIKITPVIPARKNSICRVRYGDNFGKLVQVTSVNYESGMATFEIFPSMNDGSDYIGGLEEVMPDVSDPELHNSFMENYKEILLKINEFSNGVLRDNEDGFLSNFDEGMLLEIKAEQILDKKTISSVGTLYTKTFEYEDGSVTLDDMNYPKCTFDCTCEFSNKVKGSATMGKFEVCEPDEFLCPHQISALNKKYLDEYAYEEDHDVFMMHIESIKKQADLYLAFSKNSRNI